MIKKALFVFIVCAMGIGYSSDKKQNSDQAIRTIMDLAQTLNDEQKHNVANQIRKSINDETRNVLDSRQRLRSFREDIEACFCCFLYKKAEQETE